MSPPTEHGMRKSSYFLFPWMLAIALGLVWFSSARAQDILGSPSPRLAPGVLTTIPPEVNREDTVSVHDIVELRRNADLRRDPAPMTKSPTLYEMAEAVDFRHELWCLELSFKPLRMIYVDVPQTSGKMQRKLVWYLVYRIRNTGAGLGSEQQPDGTYQTVERSPGELQFIPQFLLTSLDRDREGRLLRKAYLDRIIPTAIKRIQRRERIPGKLLNSAQMAEVSLAVEKGRAVQGAWGVATWEDVDPQIDFFSVVVGGLTNAYQWQDPPGKNRRLQYKKLRLHFWRPGDTYAEDEREIRYGPAPGKADLYGTGEGVAYQWIYQ